MESDTTKEYEITAKEIAEKFNIKGKILNFYVPSKANASVVSDKHLLFIVQVEEENEAVLSKGRIERDTKKSKQTTKNK